MAKYTQEAVKILEKRDRMRGAALEMYEDLKTVLPWAKAWIDYLQKNIGPGQGKGAKEIFENIEAVLASIDGGK